MAFIPDNSFQQRLEDKISPMLWDFYQYACMKRNHKEKTCDVSVDEFCELYNYKRASKFNLKKEIKTSKWFDGEDGAYILLVGDFSPVDKKYESKKIDSQSKNLDSDQEKSTKIDSEGEESLKNWTNQSKKIDSPPYNPQEEYLNTKPAINQQEREGTRPPTQKLSVDEVLELEEIHRQKEIEYENQEFVLPRAIEIYQEVFPNHPIDGDVLKDFCERLPEVVESVWRQTLKDWRINRYKPQNITGIISRYEKDLKEFEEETNAISYPNQPQQQQFKSERERRERDKLAEAAYFAEIERRVHESDSKLSG